MTLSEIGGQVRSIVPGLQVRFQESDGKFAPPKSTVVFTTPVGGGRPAQTEGPETGGVLEDGPEESAEVTQSVAKPGGAVGGLGRVKRAVGLGLVVFVGVLIVQ